MVTSGSHHLGLYSGLQCTQCASKPGLSDRTQNYRGLGSGHPLRWEWWVLAHHLETFPVLSRDGITVPRVSQSETIGGRIRHMEIGEESGASSVWGPTDHVLMGAYVCLSVLREGGTPQVLHLIPHPHSKPKVNARCPWCFHPLLVICVLNSPFKKNFLCCDKPSPSCPLPIQRRSHLFIIRLLSPVCILDTRWTRAQVHLFCSERRQGLCAWAGGRLLQLVIRTTGP